MRRLSRPAPPPRIDPDRWVAPPAPAPRASGAQPGALHGSRIYDQPAHAAVAARVRAFCAPGPPLALEIGVDRGYRLLCHARRWPAWRWIGVELRRTLPKAGEDTPDNALLVRADARALVPALVPPGRLARVDILFPSPSDNPRHLLLTPDFVETLRTAFAPGGVLLLRTDLPGLVDTVADLFAHWQAVHEPLSGPTESRRERVCRQSERPVWTWCLSPPGVDRPQSAPPLD